LMMDFEQAIQIVQAEDLAWILTYCKIK